jgi:hypothetical protein
MNERIKQLELEAIAYADSRVPVNDRYNDIYHSIVRGKFAKLIVWECGQYLNSPEFIGRSDLDWAMVLNEHFGVEE